VSYIFVHSQSQARKNEEGCGRLTANIKLSHFIIALVRKIELIQTEGTKKDRVRPKITLVKVVKEEMQIN
jgi:hypothetical protein